MNKMGNYGKRKQKQLLFVIMMAVVLLGGTLLLVWHFSREETYLSGFPGRTAAPADVPSDDTVARLWTGPTAETNKTHTVEIWRLLAQRYAERNIVAGYDLLNEPDLPDEVSTADLVALYERIIAAIREVDTDHMVIIEGDYYAGDFSMFNAPLDSNQVYEFHAYGLFGGPWETPGIEALQPHLDLRDEQQVPIWLGEFGEDTLDWDQQMVSLMAEHGIGWAFWPWKRVENYPEIPAIQIMVFPNEWKAVYDYLVAPGLSPQPSREAALVGLEAFLQAIRLENCTEDGELVQVLIPNP